MYCSSHCTDGAKICSSCQHRGPREVCARNGTICHEWSHPLKTCAETERRCKRYDMKCVRTQMLCEGPYKECVDWKERTCVQHQEKCNDRRYKIKGKNQYCADCGKHGYSYNWCRWYDGLEGGETVGAIFTLGLSLLGDYDWEYCNPGTSKCFGYHRPYWAPCEQYSRPECARYEDRCRSRPNECVEEEEYCALSSTV